ncbi:16S rRNA (cytidine(1402)-2'-O)-methyltransferase [Seongchinamella unica]|uniref:Ribosomal RNA small subunit methyltransferase I n=1 Tax=Seongchinamella unica TaxID=2547392 RepID=A0A4R5LV59_9GAMM|nr:16S rRNA (cytidine(1402)-2'-O)-methyltransferase [Seongchinamella unica]TDG15088.1 16S rRNA (cytidine(1402)-2'-O)-methyltransferase [Seongchinamella unica]
MESGLYIVATPIGNLGDISSRAIEVLRGVDLIAAEDTRHSQRLLQHYAIDNRLIPYHDHSDGRSQDRICELLAAGGSVALISDAGTPLISDPGYRLVRDMQARGYMVRPVPGPSAVIAALSVCGLPTDSFRFEGFLPAKPGTRENSLRALADEAATLVFYEAPHRIADTLQAMLRVFGGEREAVLAREITKTFETVRRASLAGLVDFVSSDANQQKGEIVLIVAGQVASDTTLDAATARLLRALARELPAKKAAALVAEHSGLRKKDLYNYLLSVKEH